MNVRYYRYISRITMLAVGLFTAVLVFFVIPVLNQAGPKGAGNDSPEFPAMRDAMRAYNDEGRALLAAGKGAEAEAAFRKAQEAIPTGRNIDARVGIAEARYLQGKREEAVELFRRVVEEDGQGDPEMLLQYGRMCDRAGLHQEAMRAYRQAFAVQPPGTFPVELSENPSDAEVREKAVVALRTYQQGAPDWQVKLDRELAGKEPQ